MAAMNSTIRSPACSPTRVAPRMRSLAGTVSTFTMPRATPSAMARSSSSMPNTDTSCGTFCSFASVSFNPTRATSGSVNVAHGIAE